MEILLCLVGVAIFWMVILPALSSSGGQSRQEEDEAAVKRIARQ